MGPAWIDTCHATESRTSQAHAPQNRAPPRQRQSRLVGCCHYHLLIAIAPVVTIFVLALQSSGDSWSHLVANVLPGVVRRTLALMAGVGALTLLIGTGTAWLVTMYHFLGRSVLQWLLLLPLAIPTYIIAYCSLELFD